MLRIHIRRVDLDPFAKCYICWSPELLHYDCNLSRMKVSDCRDLHTGLHVRRDYGHGFGFWFLMLCAYILLICMLVICKFHSIEVGVERF